METKKQDESALVALRTKESETKKAFEKSVKATPFSIEDTMAARTAYDKVQTEISDWLDKNKSPEERLAEKEYTDAKAALDAAIAKEKATRTALEAALAKVGKKLTVERAQGDHSRKLSYEDAQEIRRKLAAGSTNKEIKAEYGNSDSSIMYIRNYLQHKLKRGDIAHTPLINAFYPFGAPLNGEAYKELPDAERFKVKNWQMADLLEESKKTKLPELAAKYGTSERAILDSIESGKKEIANAKSRKQTAKTA